MFIRSTKFVLYGPFKEIDAKPEMIMSIYQELIHAGLQLLPGTFQELNPALGLKPIDRIMFNNTSENMSVQIGNDHLEIDKISIADKMYKLDKDSIDLNHKIKKIFNSMAKAQPLFNSGTRVAMVNHTIYDMEKVNPINDIYEQFNNRIPSYNPGETFEWNTRAAKREKLNIVGNEEEINIVTEVLRNSGQLSSLGNVLEFDAVQSRFDVNTVITNSKQRINKEFIDIFVEEVNQRFTSHCSEIEVKILGSTRD